MDSNGLIEQNGFQMKPSGDDVYTKLKMELERNGENSLNSSHENTSESVTNNMIKTEYNGNIDDGTSLGEPKQNEHNQQQHQHQQQQQQQQQQPSLTVSKVKNYKVEIPTISFRDLHPQCAHTEVNELEQFGYLCLAPGSKRETIKYGMKLKNLELEECIKRAKKYAMEQSVRYVLVKQQQQQQKQQLDLIKKQQALLLMCRIYVGSIFYEVKEETVRLSFSSFGPIRSISMSWDVATNKHKGFAFIEFETPEAAQLSLEQMNGALLGGRNIKVGRPSNMPQAQPIIDQLTEEAKNYNRIYVASIHPELSEQDVQSVFEAFGTINSCALVRDAQTGKHKGYGFIEYETNQAAQDAITSMNLFDLGGQFLRVGKAVTPPEGVTQPANTPQLPTASVIAAANINAQLGHDVDKTIQNSINLINKVTQAQANLTTVTSSSSVSATNSQTSVSVTPNSTTSSTSIISNSLNTVTSPARPTITSLDQTNQLASNLSKTTLQPQPTPASVLSNAAIAAQKVAAASTSASSSPIISSNLSAQNALLESLGPLGKIELTENQKKLLGMTSADDPSASLEQQVDITLKGKEQRLMLMQKLMLRKPESKVVVLRNMVGPEDVDSELENEITDECGKFGEVERVVIYQEKQGEEDDAEVIVKIFVEFTASKSAEKAIEALNGRYFAGRVVKAEIYDQTAYFSKDYSG